MIFITKICTLIQSIYMIKLLKHRFICFIQKDKDMENKNTKYIKEAIQNDDST